MNYTLIAVLAVVIVILGMALLHKSKPAVERFEDAAMSIMPAMEDSLQSLLTKAELRLTSTADEDEGIAHHQRNIDRLTKEKAVKRKQLETHIANLQAHLNGPAA